MILDGICKLPANIDVEGVVKVIATDISDGKCMENWIRKVKPYFDA